MEGGRLRSAGAALLAVAVVAIQGRLLAGFPVLVGSLFLPLFRDGFRGLGGVRYGARRRIARALPDVAGAFSRVLHRTTGVFSDALRCAAGPLARVLDGTARALTDVLDCAASALAHVLHGAASALADILDRAASALAHVLHGAASALANVLDRAAGTFAYFAYGLAGSGADLAGGGLHAAADVLEELRVAVQRSQDAVDDHGDVVEADVEQCLGLDALDLQLHLAEEDVRADVQPEHVEDLGDEGDVRLQVLDLKGDLVHLELRDVQMNVRALAAGVRDGLALAAFAGGAAGLCSVGRVVPHDSPSGPPLPGLDQRKRQSGIRRGLPPSPWAPR